MNEYKKQIKELNNEDFKVIEFEHFKNEVERHTFTMSPSKMDQKNKYLI